MKSHQSNKPKEEVNVYQESKHYTDLNIIPDNNGCKVKNLQNNLPYFIHDSCDYKCISIEYSQKWLFWIYVFLMNIYTALV